MQFEKEGKGERQRIAICYTYPQLPIQKEATGPGSIFNQQGGSIFNRRQQAESIRKMAEWVEGHFDKRVFQAFVKSLGIYPIGSLVRLSSGRIGVVVEQTNHSLTTPRVKVFFSTKSDMRIPAEIVDLSLPGATDKIATREDPEKWKFHDLNELWSGLTGTH